MDKSAQIENAQNVNSAAKRKRMDDRPNTPENSAQNVNLKRRRSNDMERFGLSAELSTLESQVIGGRFVVPDEPFYPEPYIRWDQSKPRLYHAYCIQTNENVVVKRILADRVGRVELAVTKRYHEIRSKCSPRFYGSVEKDGFLYLAVEKLPADLFDVQRKLHDYCFTPISATRLTLEALGGIEDLHKMGFVHADIKPSNMMLVDMESSGAGLLRIIDQGLARKWCDGRGQPKQPRNIGRLIGTVRYASLDVMNNMEPTRKDDLISLFYSYHEMVGPPLPWTECEAWMDRDPVGAMAEIKRRKADPANSPRAMATRLGPQWVAFIDHVESLKYDETPNYAFMKQCLVDYLESLKFDQSRDQHDWIEQGVVM